MVRERFYGNLAFYYDFICGDRKSDVNVLKMLINKHKKSKGTKLLDVACGTGLEDKYLKKSFKVNGIDKNRGVLQIARKRNPEIKYKSSDMRTFNLKERFDVITCFDAIPYLLNYKNLKIALNNFFHHLVKGGVLVFYLDGVFLKNHSEQNRITISKNSKKDLNVILFENSYTKGNIVETNLIFLIRRGKNLKAKQTDLCLDFFLYHKLKVFSTILAIEHTCTVAIRTLLFQLKNILEIAYFQFLFV
jgi:SAM-dependent methyltransferase